MVRLKGGVRGMGTLFGALLLLLFVGTAYGAREDRPLWVRYPAVSPDGRNVAFCYRGVLFVVPTAGGEARALTTGTDYAAGPIWSPDGKQIAYEGHRYGNADIFLLPIEGGAPTRLTTHSTWEPPWHSMRRAIVSISAPCTRRMLGAAVSTRGGRSRCIECRSRVAIRCCS